MDEDKRPARPILKLTFYVFILGSVLFLAYAGSVYWQIQTIEDPKRCFTTKMHQVQLCPSSPNYVRYKSVPKHFFQALILSEDASFYSHQGFDWFEIKESFRRNIVEWRFARGGSTLTQQLAKNLYLSKEKSLSRKFKEFFIAKQIEEKLSKSQILEKYVNVVEFGEKLFGLKPAAEFYFNKSPALLNILESVYLVSLLPNPEQLGRSLNERKLSSQNLWRMKVILQRLYRTQKISDESFIYLKMLLEDSDWPFDHYSEGMFDPLSLEEQIFEEFETLEQEDAEFLKPNSPGEDQPNSANEPLEPPQETLADEPDGTDEYENPVDSDRSSPAETQEGERPGNDLSMEEDLPDEAVIDGSESTNR